VDGVALDRLGELGGEIAAGAIIIRSQIDIFRTTVELNNANVERDIKESKRSQSKLYGSVSIFHCRPIFSLAHMGLARFLQEPHSHCHSMKTASAKSPYAEFTCGDLPERMGSSAGVRPLVSGADGVRDNVAMSGMRMGSRTLKYVGKSLRGVFWVCNVFLDVG
jgi:hypothetical protein